MSRLKNKQGPGARVWFNLCLFGMIGQIAWNLENMYFNTFLYNTVYEGGTVTAGLASMKAIKLMVALSAVTAVVTTFIMGNLSDKVHKRKIFMSVGYILWGLTVVVFGFITKENIAALFGIDISDTARVVTATAVFVVVMDCVMTFMGSTSNDSAFNAWVTDVGDSTNRATFESILSILPVAATVVVVVFAGFIEQIGYPVFFFIIGGIVVLSGIIGLFTVTDSLDGVKKNENYFKELFYGFRPSVIRENSRLYLSLAAVCVYSVAVQVWFPYLLIYLEHSMGIKLEDLTGYITKPVLIAAPFAVAAVVAVLILGGRLIDKIGKEKLLVPALILFFIGQFGAYFAHSILPFAICALPLLAGYAFIGIMLNASVRDYTPEDKVGLFQGIRMIFAVLIPMVLGPWIGDFVCSVSASGQYIDETGASTYEPCSAMFLAGAVVILFTFIPVVILKRKNKKTE